MLAALTRAFVREYFDMMFPRRHSWREIKPGLRECRKCGTRDYLGERQFASIMEPRWRWRQEGTPCRGGGHAAPERRGNEVC